MNNEYIIKGSVITGLVWLAVAALIGGAWSVMLVDPERWRIAGMLAATACATSAAAAALQVRCYAARIVALVRVGAGLDDQRPPVRAVR